ncbi:hypothetical protein CW304_21170 [Bacillus sp. UFRGS-B20]|nr:hypothetical protein CW304_21170 [Bacillus sp. UFRGS-B20]
MFPIRKNIEKENNFKEGKDSRFNREIPLMKLKFQGTVPVSITGPIACKTDCFCLFIVLHKASYLTKRLSAPSLLRKVPVLCFTWRHANSLVPALIVIKSTCLDVAKNARILSAYLTKRFHKF